MNEAVARRSGWVCSGDQDGDLVSRPIDDRRTNGLAQEVFGFDCRGASTQI
jgi:hypothetical protein